MHTNIHKYIGYICYICNHFTRLVVSSCNWIWLWVCRKCANVCGAESMRVCQLCVCTVCMHVCVQVSLGECETVCDSLPHGWVSSSATLLDTFAEEAARRGWSCRGKQCEEGYGGVQRKLEQRLSHSIGIWFRISAASSTMAASRQHDVAFRHLWVIASPSANIGNHLLCQRKLRSNWPNYPPLLPPPKVALLLPGPSCTTH